MNKVATNVPEVARKVSRTVLRRWRESVDELLEELYARLYRLEVLLHAGKPPGVRRQNISNAIATREHHTSNTLATATRRQKEQVRRAQVACQTPRHDALGVTKMPRHDAPGMTIAGPSKAGAASQLQTAAQRLAEPALAAVTNLLFRRFQHGGRDPRTACTCEVCQE